MKTWKFLYVRYDASKDEVVRRAKAQAMLEGKPFGEWLLSVLEESVNDSEKYQ